MINIYWLPSIVISLLSSEALSTSLFDGWRKIESGISDTFANNSEKIRKTISKNW